MSTEWIRFIFAALFLLLALICFTSAVVGANRFGFAMNRLHAAGIADTAGLLLLIIGLLEARGFADGGIKLLLIAFFLWFTSPVSSHFLSQLEYYTNSEIYKFMDRK